MKYYIRHTYNQSVIGIRARSWKSEPILINSCLFDNMDFKIKYKKAIVIFIYYLVKDQLFSISDFNTIPYLM